MKVFKCTVVKKRLILLMMICCLAFAGCDSSEKETDDKKETNAGDLEKVDNSDIVVLFTNDVHCGIEEGLGYAGVASYKDRMLDKTPYVTLVDCGDAIQGDYIGVISNGEYIVDIMNEVGYDMAILGNHEFDYGMEQLSKLIDKAKASYMACNITYTGKGESALSKVKPYEIKEYGDTKIAYIGVSTPETTTKSTHTYFMEDGEFVYDFAGGNGDEFYDLVQKNIDECKDKGADYIFLLTHLGDAMESSPYTSTELVAQIEGVDVVLDAHSHSTVACRVLKDEVGEEVLVASTGTKLDNMGQVVITTDGNIYTGLVDHYEYKDEEVDKYISNIKAQYEEEMGKKVASSDIGLSCSNEEGIRLVRNRETAIGNLCADAYRIVGGADVGMVNGGGIRADLPAGDITYADIIGVHPFGNTLCVAKVSGQEIADVLEIGAVAAVKEVSENGLAAGENGSFMNVSG
ncbi:MAG: bifunctional metallophosphatase/5'-nucleotidase, partial [Lachnospiraceae bacterium]|nr:bifunctional metallophosphatase/5'-nucleotidase [Lachnospiraceae bacterium]